MNKPQDWNDMQRQLGTDAARRQWDAAPLVPFDSNRGGGTAEAGGRLIARRASDIAIVPVDWLWPGRVAIGKLTLIAGEPGLGKSQLALAMVAAVTTGGEWPCNEGRAPRGNVIILAAEDGVADTVVPRLEAAGADRRRVHIVSAVRDDAGHRVLDLAADLELLVQKIRETGDVRMVVIDPISSYLGARIDSHNNTAVRGTLEPVCEMADRLHVAIVAITHQPKVTGTAAMHRFIGSIAFVAAARAAYMVTRDPDDETRCLLLPVKNNLAPVGQGLAFRLEQRIVAEPGIVASSVVWDAVPVTISADQALSATDAARDGVVSPRADAIEYLRDKLSAGPVPVKEVDEHARALGIAPRTLGRARKALGVRTVKDGFGGGWLLSLPDEDCQDGPKTATSVSGSLRQSWQPSDTPPPTPPAEADILDIPPFLRRSAAGGSPVA
jgi:putative DNA primase/helicase